MRMRRRRMVGAVGVLAAVGLSAAMTLPPGVTGGSAGAAETVRADEVVVIDPASPGRTFDGLGAVSASGSSRLLYDYPEPERSQILDYLFKPGYGAALQMLKVEIGADTNSTSGAEPSHMRERGEVDCDRGYEWWLMTEATKRNPDIVLSGLPWGAPGWIEGGFWSQDTIDYLMSWLDCAGQHGLRIDFMGGWNESGYDRDWFVAFERALAEHHPEVRVAAADDEPHRGWRVAADMVADPEFGAAVDIANLHSPCGHRTLYQVCQSTPVARDLGKPLWIGELSAMAHDAGAQPLARVANRMYIDARITGMMAWTPISAWYSNVTLADTGLMVAEWPWSGFYDVGDSIWAYAHTTQFAQPGWRYLDSGSRRLASGGTVVSLLSPDGADFSAVVETLDAIQPATVTFDVGAAPADDLQVWSTDFRSDDPAERFRHVGTVSPRDGRAAIDVEPGHVYSVTTTSGQGKGDARPAADAAEQLSIPFHETFESVAEGSTARYFSDLAGRFEAVPCGGGREGTCYGQQITVAPISWGLVGELPLNSLFGDPRWWGDYAVRADVMLEEEGHVELGGRVSGQSWGTEASGYHLRVGTDGWSLHSRDHAGRRDVTLASGAEPIDVGSWHEVELHMRGDELELRLDGDLLARVHDTTQRTGNAAIGVSAWTRAQFDDVSVTPTARAPRFVPQDDLTVTATSEHGFERGWTREAANLVDDRPETMWSSRFDPPAGLPQTVTLDLGRAQPMQALTYQPRLDGNTSGMITSYEVYLSSDGKHYDLVADGTWSADSSTKVAAWDRQSARYVRLVAPDDQQACEETTASGNELRVVRGIGPSLETTPPAPDRAALPPDAPAAFDHLVPQDDITVTASSVHSPPNIPCKAVDGRRTTYWHSAPAVTGPLPASVTLDLGGTHEVGGLAYLPRQDGNPNGTITAYQVEVSTDGQTYTRVAGGTWADNPAQKYATWSPAAARYVRLTATAGHFNVASAAELHVGRVP